MNLIGKQLVTHPDNQHLLDGWLKKAGVDQVPWSLDVILDKYVEKEKPTGRIINPDGTTSYRKGWTWQLDRFTMLEEGDLRWAIPLGIIREQMEAVFYVMPKPLYVPRLFDLGPTLSSPRYLIKNAS